MALIKCPECKNNVSDKAESCPKCGYELNKKSKNKSNSTNDKMNPKFRGKVDYKYIILGLLIIVVGFYMLNQNNDKNDTHTNDKPTTEDRQGGNTNPGTYSGYVVYNDNNLKMSYEIPSNYKTYAENSSITYVGQSIDEAGALIPYMVLGCDNNYANPVQFLNAFTDELRKVYSDVIITIDLVSDNIGIYYVYGIQYKYTTKGHTVIDNRYATMVGNKVFMVGTREENTNTEEMNNNVRVVFNTLKGVN